MTAARAASELAHQAQLERLERGDPLVAVEHEPGGPEQLVAGPAVQQRVEQRGEVGDQRAVAHVAEVDDRR